jgi:hypothetical protein
MASWLPMTVVTGQNYTPAKIAFSRVLHHCSTCPDFTSVAILCRVILLIVQTHSTNLFNQLELLTNRSHIYQQV